MDGMDPMEGDDLDPIVWVEGIQWNGRNGINVVDSSRASPPPVSSASFILGSRFRPLKSGRMVNIVRGGIKWGFIWGMMDCGMVIAGAGFGALKLCGKENVKV
ncbi:hypothetical protein CEXT_578051 [Caerostris extrusa]|uniref:Uncharacterized protein n=1 Tax=Caerostris extrusa TaxID=172846 RepID=A0AAV4QKZ8_CAEEX|nr:hypothetical protein CEXT_578051 [Caerostris extrusa]